MSFSEAVLTIPYYVIQEEVLPSPKRRRVGSAAAERFYDEDKVFHVNIFT
jgi:hypothetical protein